MQQAGVYALDYATIVAQQPALSDCRSDDLQLTSRGHEVPVRIAGDRDGMFGSQAHVEWIGDVLHGPSSWFDPYSPVNVYILSASAGTHARMRAPMAPAGSARSATLVRRVHLEQDNLLIRLNSAQMKPGDEPDVWQWAKLTHADPQPFSLTFDLPDLRTTGAAATLDASLVFRGVSYVPRHAPDAKPVDHVVDVTINGKPAGSIRWDGRDETRHAIALPMAALKATGNVLGLTTPVRYASWNPENPVVDVVMFNSVDLAYPIGGDASASHAPFEVLSAAAGSTPAASTPIDSTAIELGHAAGAPVALYGSDGRFDTGSAGANGRQRFASAVAGVSLHASTPGDLLKPVRVRAVADADWRKSDPGYDYLIVSHRSLIDAIAPLAEFHSQKGYRVAVVDVDQVYDQFNGGITHPVAIRNLISWGREHWQVKPRYVLLVGTASFDNRAAGRPVSMQPASFDPRTGVPFSPRPDNPAPDNRGASADGSAPPNRNLIPTWQYPTQEGQSASDNSYVATSDSDYHPALAIGRLPVVSAEETQAIVNKTIGYGSVPTLGAWRSKVMFIANEDNVFQSASDQIAAEVEHQGFGTDRIYGKVSETDNLANQAAINSGLNAGNLLVHFLGHGGRFIWRTGPPDLNKNHDLFTLDDVSNLSNGNRLPMVLSMTCFSAPFDNPSEDSIGERFLREPGKGAVAVFAASWSNSPSPEFSKKLVAELVKPGRTIGEAIVAAKAPLNNRTLVEMYNLLGDPAIVLERPRDTLAIARSGDRWQDTVAVRVPESGFGGLVTVNWLDGAGATISMQTYEARDSQFTLAIPSANVAQVHIYVANPRTGRDAMGSLDFRPPKPAPEPKRTLPKPASPKPPPAKSAAADSAPVPQRPDPITHSGFESATQLANAKPRAPVRKQAPSPPALRATVAVKPGAGKREP